MTAFAVLAEDERATTIAEAADRLGIPAVIVEKDFWVCWMLRLIFSTPDLAPHLVFKGGTSLSKVFGAIQRFSEDVDLSVAPELLGFDESSLDDAPSRSMRNKRFAKLESACAKRVRGDLRAITEREARAVLGSPPRGREWLVYELDAISGSPVLVFAYPSAVELQAGYITPAVKLEFGSLTDQRPTGTHPIRPLLAEALAGEFDDWRAEVVTLEIERTFWEKATILHAEHHRPPGQPARDRFARHYADLAALWQHPARRLVLERLDLLDRVARFKSRFFRSSWSHYESAKPPTLKLCPPAHREPALAQDYAKMESMFIGKPPAFRRGAPDTSRSRRHHQRGMSASNFAFLADEWPELHDAATKAEALAHPDPRAACFYARRALELTVVWLYRHDGSLRLPYQEHLSALIHEPTFRDAVGPAIFTKAKLLKDLGNQAVHSARPMRLADALTAVRELFHVGFWMTRTYGRRSKPADTLTFDAARLPKTTPVPAQTQAQLQALGAQLAERDTRLSELLAGRAALDDELKRLRDEIARAKAANTARPDTHDYSEAATRDFFIDLLLKEAGWALDQARDREFEVSGMPNQKGQGFVDYVLWGDDGKPLGLVEAKRTKRDPRAGQQQAKLYADCLERQFGQRPVIFYSNGYDHWLWDDDRYPPRAVQGFLKKTELELAIQRRTTRRSLARIDLTPGIVERFYQTRAIRRIAESFEKDNLRKALVVMATGSGKTRTVIALCDLLMRSNWAKRVLFLADRVALVRQAVSAFKAHLPSASPVNLVTEKDKEGRVYVSTYPTMMGLIDETRDGQRPFGVEHFDLVIVDEAHRSVYQKYRAIFEYFDALLVGLTATPKDEIDRNTYSLFELETGVPTDVYGLEEAVKDGFLVPPKAVSVPLAFQREGIRYDQLSDEDKEQWDAIEWSEDGGLPDRVEAAAVNRWLFNKDTVDKVLEHLMTRGLMVAGGDRLGKTIIFAKNHDHAEFIADRFNANYPHYKGAFARVIDFQVEYAQTLIDDFSLPDKGPHIAISVDMLDTGIDVPEIVNLVFFKLVRSKTKFWQMLGRGTRLRPDLFGPGRHKEFFYVFDYCQNLEFFSQNPATTEGSSGASLGKRLFTSRVELIGEIDRKLCATAESAHEGESRDHYGEPRTDVEVRHDVAALLRNHVASMNLDNFIVRPRRRLVEKYAKADAWKALTTEDVDELARDVAGLPSELVDDDEEAKRFDLLMLCLQLTVLRSEAGFTRLRDQVRSIAGMLEEKSSIPIVSAEMELIQEIQTDTYWEDVTIPMLERARKRLRALVKLIEKVQRSPIYTDFEDDLGPETTVELPGFGAGREFERFRAKARQFLREHETHLTVHKLRWNEPLTARDLEELERMLVESGVGTAGDVARAKQESSGLGLFIRSLVGLDREAAKHAFGQFLAGRTPSADQIEFVNLIIDHLTDHGIMEPARLYESPFTDINPRGPEGVFTSSQVDELISLLHEIRERAAA